MRYPWYVLCAAVLTAAGLSKAAPQPQIVPPPDVWTLEAKFEHLQPITVTLPGDSQPKVFWYLILTVTNRTKRDIDFYPKCDLMTDTFQIVPAGSCIPPDVFEQIKQRHRRKYPLLEPIEQAGSRLLQGADNAKDFAVIWPDFDSKADKVRLFVSGLSNETVAVDNPKAKDQSGQPVKIYLRKTLELTYAVSGDPAHRADAKVTYGGKRWVMR